MNRQAICILCSRPERANPEKIVTCGDCVQYLLSIPVEERIKYKNALLSKGLDEAARSVEFFIPEEGNGEIATFNRTLVLRRVRGLSTPRRPQIERRIRSLAAIKEKIENGREETA